MYSILPQQKYNPAYALAEFIDNAIHAHQFSNKRQDLLTITLDFYTSDYKKDVSVRNSIVISDDGPGMGESELKTAFKPASKPKISGLSEFGIGMKAASVWFSNTWTLITKSSNDSEFIANFNLSELLSANHSSITVSEESPEISGTGTIIKLINTRRTIDDQNINKITETLRDLYQKFTYYEEGKSNYVKTDIQIRKNGEAIGDANFKKDKTLEILNAPIYKSTKGVYFGIGEYKTWKVNLDFEFQKQRITGFIQLHKKGSYLANPGIILFRNGRVILGTRTNPYIPTKLFKTKNKYQAQRVYGEICIDGLPVTYTKDDIDFDENLFVESLLNNFDIQNLIEQAGKFRASTSDKDTVFVDSEEDIKKYFEELEQKRKAEAEAANKRKAQENNDKNDKDRLNGKHHNENWDTLLPDDLTKTKNQKLNSLLLEATSLKIKEHPYSSVFLLRSIIEIGLFEFLKQKGKLQSVINYDFEKRVAKAEDPESVQKIKKPGLDHMLTWIESSPSIFDDDEKNCMSSKKKITHDLKAMNGVVHQFDLIGSNKVIEYRDNAYTVIKHIINDLSKKDN
nr:ATP-binding protein [Hydrogenovibrio sp. JE_KL2]